MIWSLLFVLWILFAIMLACGFAGIRRGSQVMGISMPKAALKDNDIKGVTRRYGAGIIIVFTLSAALSLLFLIPSVKDYVEILMIILVIANIAASGFCYTRAQKALLRLRTEKGWQPRLKKSVTVDLEVSREKGKHSVSPVFVWLFFALSFAPLIVLIVKPSLRVGMPIFAALTGPVCQLGFTAIYYKLRRSPARLTGEDTAAVLLLAKKTERLQTACATLMALSELLFWIAFFASCAVLRSSTACIAATAVFLIALLIIAVWQQRALNSLENSFSEITEETGAETDGEYRWGCYYGPDDPRLFVPKPVAGMGWTINIGRPAGKAILASIWILLAIILILALASGLQGFDVELNGDNARFDAVMYDLTVDRDDIAGVELIDEIPAGTRTNGYGGVSKAFGHFNLNGYGDCMLYVYNDTPNAVVLTLADEAGYVIFNAETAEATEALYEDFRNWSEQGQMAS